MFRENLLLMRRRKELTQKELAKLLGMNHVTISRYETGDIEPGLLVLVKMKRLFECTYDQLIGVGD